MQDYVEELLELSLAQALLEQGYVEADVNDIDADIDECPLF